MTILDALGPGGEYRTRKRELITDVSGAAVAEMTIVPRLYVARTVNAQRRARPLPPAGIARPRWRARWTMFLSKEIAGFDFDRYVAITSRVSGLPIAVVRARARTAWQSRWRPYANRCGRPNRLGRNVIGVTFAKVARCGRAAARCSPCTRRETRRGFTVSGRRR